MFQIEGKVIQTDRLESGYYALKLQRNAVGLLGPELTLLVPSLVAIRDGLPEPGNRVEIGAQGLATSEERRHYRSYTLVARYIREPGPPGDRGTESAAEG